MWCPRCHASIPAERSARFCGNCGTILTSRQAWGVTITFPTEKTILSNYQSQVVARDTVRLPLERPSPSPARTDSPSPAPLQRSALPAQPPQLRPPHHPIRSSRHRILIAFFILLLLAGVTLGITFPLTTITVKPQPGVSPSGKPFSSIASRGCQDRPMRSASPPRISDHLPSASSTRPGLSMSKRSGSLPWDPCLSGAIRPHCAIPGMGSMGGPVPMYSALAIS